MMTTKRLAATVLTLLAPVAVLVSTALLRAGSPDPVPVHWNLQGDVDDTASAGGFFITTLVIALVLAAVAAAAIWLGHSPLAGRMLAALCTFGAWVAAAICVATFTVAHGADRAADVHMPWYAIAAVIVLPLALGAGTWALLPGRWQHALTPSEVPAPSLTFARGEHVVWIGHAHSPVMRTGSWVAGIAGVVLIFVQTSVAIPVLIAAAVFAFVSELAVRVDARGVHTLWGPFGWPRPRIRLADITAASAEEINPMRWGGWGYRVSARGVAAVVRRGPGLVIDRADRPSYAVTVDDAARGADVVNALLARERTQQ